MPVNASLLGYVKTSVTLVSASLMLQMPFTALVRKLFWILPALWVLLPGCLLVQTHQ